MDFTLTAYNKLLKTLLQQGFSFQTFADFVLKPQDKSIVLRHDVDLFPLNSLKFAQIQAKENIIGSYYFRFVPGSYNEKIIKEIHNLGHEIGYHYETMDTCNGDIDHAYDLFSKNLEILRRLIPVKTICMHGSPLSKYDNRLIWQKYDYRKLGIIGEPYFDIDFSKVLYLTDTGRRWDGDSYNIRDKAVGGRQEAVGKMLNEIRNSQLATRNSQPETNNSKPSNLQPSAFRLPPFPKFRSTFDIIHAAEAGELPDQIMMTFHPQRWTNKPIPWMKELVWQNVKNIGKYFLIKMRN